MHRSKPERSHTGGSRASKGSLAQTEQKESDIDVPSFGVPSLGQSQAVTPAAELAALCEAKTSFQPHHSACLTGLLARVHQWSQRQGVKEFQQRCQGYFRTCPGKRIS